PLSVPHTTAASEFLYGSSAVLAALKAKQRKIYKLYVHPRAENFESGESSTSLARIARASGIDVKNVSDNWIPVMDKMSGGRPHNGCILDCSPLPRLPITALQSFSVTDGRFTVRVSHQSREEKEINGQNGFIKYESHGWRKPFVLFLDSILDPGNLGAILRTAYFLGVDAVAMSTRNIAPLNAVALKASAGAAEGVKLLSVSDPVSFLESSGSHGWQIYAASSIVSTSSGPRGSSSGQDAYSDSSITFTKSKTPFKRLPDHNPLATHPTILMLGSEGTGLRGALLAKAQYNVGITAAKSSIDLGVDSLNVSVAAAILSMRFMRPPKRSKSNNLE
ncbi:alpha/beta knot, partial [Patellaria atrata CBS 101060]